MAEWKDAETDLRRRWGTRLDAEMVPGGGAGIPKAMCERATSWGEQTDEPHQLLCD